MIVVNNDDTLSSIFDTADDAESPMPFSLCLLLLVLARDHMPRTDADSDVVLGFEDAATAIGGDDMLALCLKS